MHLETVGGTSIFIEQPLQKWTNKYIPFFTAQYT